MLKKTLMGLGWAVTAVLGLGITSYLLLLAINWKDDPLHPEVARLAAAQLPPLSSEPNAFFGLIGLYAPEDQDPDAWGRTWFQQARALDEALAVRQERAGKKMDAKPAIEQQMRKRTVDDKALLCQAVDNCLEQVAAKPEEVGKILDSEGIVLGRFDALLDLPYREPQRRWRFESEMPKYDAQKLSRLASMRFALLAATGRHAEALEQWKRERNFAVRRLAGAEGLLDKVHGSATLQRLHGLLAQYISRHPEAARSRAAAWGAIMTPLPDEALSLQKALDSELLLLSSFDAALLGEAGLESLSDIGDQLRKPFFLVNNTINQTAGFVLDWRDVESLKGEDYRKGIAKLREKYKPLGEDDSFHFRNPVGSLLLKNLYTDFGDYFARRDSVAAGQEVLRLAVALLDQPQPAADEGIQAAIAKAGEAGKHPYTGAVLRWDAQKRLLGYPPEGLDSKLRMPDIRL